MSQRELANVKIHTRRRDPLGPGAGANDSGAGSGAVSGVGACCSVLKVYEPTCAAPVLKNLDIPVVQSRKKCGDRSTAVYLCPTTLLKLRR